MFEQKIAFSLVIFGSHEAISFWFLLFCRFFLDPILFLNGCRNSFIVYSRSCVLYEPNFHFALVIFCSQAAFWHGFSVFFKFMNWFFGNGFPKSLTFPSMSSFCLVNEISLNCTSRLVLLRFFNFALPFDHVFRFTSWFSRLTYDLSDSLFQLNGF